MFFESYNFWRLMSNTLILSLLSLVIGFPASIILALLLNEVRNRYFKSAVQTVSYLPAGINSEQYEAAKMDGLRMKVIPVVATLSNSQIPFLKTQMVMTYDQALAGYAVSIMDGPMNQDTPYLNALMTFDQQKEAQIKGQVNTYVDEMVTHVTKHVNFRKKESAAKGNPLAHSLFLFYDEYVSSIIDVKKRIYISISADISSADFLGSDVSNP